jgi:hypothetical protein
VYALILDSCGFTNLYPPAILQNDTCGWQSIIDPFCGCFTLLLLPV